MCVDTSAAWIGICENIYVWNCGSNDIVFVNVDESVCKFDCLRECFAENVCVCVFVHEPCVCPCVRVCAVDVW